MADDFVPPWEQPSTTSPVVNQTLAAEGTGQNPNSSAVGPGQFINSTALDMVKRYRPDVAYGKSDAEILSTRTNPDYAPMWRDMTSAYAAENSERLSGAGVQPSTSNIYLAHFLGPGGALKVLKSDPTTPVSQLLDPAAIRANPQIANMTAGDIQAWAAGKMRINVGRAPQRGMTSQPSPQSAGYVPPWETPQNNQAPTGLITQAASGIMEGIQNLPGTIPRLTALAGQGIDYLTGNKEAQAEDAQRAALAASIQKNMPSITNVLPQPANTAEQYARTVGNFIPGAVAGPGGASRVITQGVLPGIASEGAGQLFKPTPYEAEARAIAPVISGLRGGAGAGAAEREASLVPTTKSLLSTGGEQIEAAKAAGTKTYTRGEMMDLVDRIKQTLRDNDLENYAPSAPGVFRTIKKLQEKTDLGGIQKVRSLIGKMGKGGGDEGRAIPIAQEEIDKFLKQHEPEAAASLEEGRGNYSAGKRAQKIEQALETASSPKQALGPIVKKYIKGNKQGFSQEEFEAMRDIYEGKSRSGLLGAGAVFAPEKGVLGLGVAGELASKVTEHLAGIAGITAALSFLGRASNKLADRMTQKDVDRLGDLVRKRSPAYKAAVEAAGNRYSDSMDAFAASPSHQNFIRFVVASRNLSAGFKRDGVNISSGDLIRQFTPAAAGANEQDQQKQ